MNIVIFCVNFILTHSNVMCNCVLDMPGSEFHVLNRENWIEYNLIHQMSLMSHKLADSHISIDENKFLLSGRATNFRESLMSHKFADSRISIDENRFFVNRPRYKF